MGLGLGLAACETGAKPPPRRGDAGITDTVGAIAGKVDGTWREVKFPEDGLALSLPGEPKENRWTFKAGGIEVPESTWVLEGIDKGIIFTVGIARMPKELLDLPMPIDEMLEKEARHFLSLEPHEIRTRRDVRVDAGDIPGLDSFVEAEIRGKPLIVRQRVFARRERRYAIAVSWRPEHGEKAEADVEKVLASVRFE